MNEADRMKFVTMQLPVDVVAQHQHTIAEMLRVAFNQGREEQQRLHAIGGRTYEAGMKEGMAMQQRAVLQVLGLESMFDTIDNRLDLLEEREDAR